MNSDRNLHIGLWLSLAAIFIWSGIGCHDTFTWFLEVLPIILGTVILLSVYSKFRFTRLVCWLMWLHAIVLMVGGHYTYAEVPLFNWIRDIFHLARNDYDRLGHFMQGFVPAMITREILLRAGIVKRGGWLFFIVVCICLAFSASYELFECLTAVSTGAKADAFLGTQGDPWDTQEDMAMALVGSITALLTLSKIHDQSMEKLND